MPDDPWGRIDPLLPVRQRRPLPLGSKHHTITDAGGTPLAACG
ncbi:hypothetical protein [Streptomyces yaizuensis]|uniref:Transposase n=1 Tax=Streptomyces yaizuensis TaxID=2989713 RepID=A0ABQ5NXJ9_9ACTN|nr:hypothetical protein [Streptomyces sp. YSPA8]GLF94957.1 hypothetical protein SYYSPA8_11690 [Streptomyces sp. YSPA8]